MFEEIHGKESGFSVSVHSCSCHLASVIVSYLFWFDTRSYHSSFLKTGRKVADSFIGG